MDTSDSGIASSEDETKIEESKSTDSETPETSSSEVNNEDSVKPEDANKEPGFKKPLLIIGPRKGTITHKFKPINKPEVEEPPPVKKSTIPALQAYSDPHTNKEKIIPLPYSEPEWGNNISNDNYSLEILKNGVIIEQIQLNTKSFYVFGRLSNCDVQMNHPSSSRYHAVLQYRAESTEKSPKGFYIYDLGSTHGTYLNKNRLKPKIYAPVKVGQFLKIGGSSRMLILQGPSEDEEPESELGVTELKKLRIQKEKEAELERLRLEKEAEIAEEKRREEIDKAGIDWGMGEDADEETDLTENPFAATTNEELYVADPKKSLRGWYEREGHELNYDVNEKTTGQFLCRVILPVDDASGRPLIAEALVRGKKKEAVVQCAMEACRILDRQGLLRQSTHEGKQRKKRDWADDDYYDSDEDTFLDRTGAVETKRQRRMVAAGKIETKTETYDSLLKQLEETRKEIIEAESALEAANQKQEASSSANNFADALDEYMSTLNQAEKTQDKVQRRAAKARVAKLHQEEDRLRKLANLARPASLPELVAPVAAAVKKLPVMVGARPSAKPRAVPKIVAPVSTVTSNEMEEDESSDEEKPPIKAPSPEISPAKIPEPKTIAETPKEESPNPKSLDSKVEFKMKEKKLGPSIPEEFLRELRGETGEEDGGKQPRKRSRNKPAQSGGLKSSPSLDEARPDYSTWVPPKDQSGDGRTKLNDKYGY